MSIPFNFQMTKANNGKAVSRTGKQSKVNYKKVIAKKKKKKNRLSWISRLPEIKKIKS